jgi:hypothetical protein
LKGNAVPAEGISRPGKPPASPDLPLPFEAEPRDFDLPLPGADTQSPLFLSMPFFVPNAAGQASPSAGLEGDENTPTRLLTVILHSTSDKGHDVRRLKRIHGLLRSSPGKDKYAFMVFEGGRRFLLEFPNDTTGISPELIRKLIELAGEGNVSVEPLKLH